MPTVPPSPHQTAKTVTLSYSGMPNAQCVGELTAHSLNALWAALLASGDFVTDWLWAATDRAYFAFSRRGGTVSAHVTAYGPESVDALLDEVRSNLPSASTQSILTAIEGLPGGRQVFQASHSHSIERLPDPNDAENCADSLEYAVEMAYQRTQQELTAHLAALICQVTPAPRPRLAALN